uniref:Rec21/ENK19 domain-containing protein n=1 Tax=Ursus maritimus TaxID=29073 RepID=A0A452UU10_URSMA
LSYRNKNTSIPCPETTKVVDVTWGQLKKLDQQATEVMQGVRAPSTPENRFLAYLAVVSQNSAKMPVGNVTALKTWAAKKRQRRKESKKSDLESDRSGLKLSSSMY